MSLAGAKRDLLSFIIHPSPFTILISASLKPYIAYTSELVAWSTAVRMRAAGTAFYACGRIARCGDLANLGLFVGGSLVIGQVTVKLGNQHGNGIFGLRLLHGNRSVGGDNPELPKV